MIKEDESCNRELIVMEESPSTHNFLEGNNFNAIRTPSQSSCQNTFPKSQPWLIVFEKESKDNIFELEN